MNHDRGDRSRRVEQHRAVIDAAAAADVSLLAYTSMLHADRSTIALARDHRETETLIIHSGLPHVVLRNGWYLENYTDNLLPAITGGAVIGSAGQGRIAAAGRADYAAAAAAVLTGDVRSGAVYELAGRGFTMAEFAGELSEQLGRAIRYRNLSAERHRAALVESGFPDDVAAVLADADRGIARGDLDAPSGPLESLIGRAPTTLTQAVSAAVATVDLSSGPAR